MKQLLYKFLTYLTFYIGEMFSLLAFKYDIPYSYRMYNFFMSKSTDYQEKCSKYIIWQKTNNEFKEFEKEMIQEQQIYSK